MSGRYGRRAAAAFCLVLLGACGDQPAPLLPKPDAAELPGADPKRGRRLVASYGCVSCHAIPDIGGPASDVGPPLGKLARRTYIGGVLPNTPDDLVRWLRDPPAVDPRTAMPAVGLSEAQARDVAAYLYTLE